MLGQSCMGGRGLRRSLVLHFGKSRESTEQVAQGCVQLSSEHAKCPYPDSYC